MKKTDWVKRFNRDLDRMLQGISLDLRDAPQDYQEALEVAGRLMAADFSHSREHQKALEGRLLGQAKTQLRPPGKAATLRQRLSGPAETLVWLVAAVLLALAFIWGINSLLPRSLPGVPVVPSPENVVPGPGLGRLAYIQRGDLWVETLPDGKAQQLTTDGLHTQPRWSPSGEWLAYRDGDDQVWVTRSDGSDGHPLAEGRVSAFAWAPGEDSLAYILDDHELRLTGAGGTGDQTLVASEQSQQIHSLAWSPDGNWIAYELRERQGDQASYLGLWKIPVSGGGAVEITDTTDFEMLAGIYQLAGWTSDGQSLIFWGGNPFFSASIAADGLPLIRVPAGGGEPQEVAQSALLYTDFVRLDPSVSGRLAVVTGGGREAWTNKRLYLFENSSSAPLSPDGEAISSVAWSPDGKRLAYSSAPDAGQLAGGEPARQALMGRNIWVLDPGSGEPHQLTDDPSYRDEYPFWSADGSTLLFVRMDDQSQVSVWTVPAAGGETQIVLDGLSTEGLANSGWFGFYGHIDWEDMFDWWRGPLPSTTTTLLSTPSATWDGQVPTALAISATTPLAPTQASTFPAPEPSRSPGLSQMQKITTSSPTGLTARQGYPLALQAAMDWRPDAVLDSVSGSWTYHFVIARPKNQDELTQVFQVTVDQNGVKNSAVVLGQAGFPMANVEDWVVDSPEAMQIAGAAGGNVFRQVKPHAPVKAILRLSRSGGLISNPATKMVL
jgi:Tol biopolymer transport system component